VGCITPVSRLLQQQQSYSSLVFFSFFSFFFLGISHNEKDWSMLSGAWRKLPRPNHRQSPEGNKARQWGALARWHILFYSSLDSKQSVLGEGGTIRRCQEELGMGDIKRMKERDTTWGSARRSKRPFFWLLTTQQISAWGRMDWVHSRCGVSYQN